MRLHVVSLPHTQVTRAFDWCAYTAKVRRLPAMLRAHGHDPIVYSYGPSDAGGKHVCLGEPEPWDDTQVFDDWEPPSPRWQQMNALAIGKIGARIKPGDAIGIIAGRCQQQLADAFPNHLKLEWGIGYAGTLPNSFRCFESHAWRAFCAAREPTDDIRWFDTVIPNAFGLDEFEEPRDHDGYYLFVGRPTERKGLAVVRELAARYPFKVAGQSDPGIPGAEYVGLVRGDDKAKLFAGAIALVAPTVYFEPFGGVAVEAQMSGVPAIVTDWGAFPETCHERRGGFRCSTLADFRAAMDIAGRYDIGTRNWIADRARARWSTDAVAPQYDRWLRRIDLLHAEGWYQLSEAM